MKTKHRLQIIFLISIMLLSVSCAPGAPVENINDIVVVLVVDAFSNDTAKAEQTDTSCAVTVDGQKYRGEGSTAVAVGEPHGFFVYKDLINQIDVSEEFSYVTGEGADFLGAPSLGRDWLKRFDLYALNANPDTGLFVVAVDSDGFNLDSMSQNISAAFDLFSASNSNLRVGNLDLPPTKRFVVNMSFVLIPCDPDPVLALIKEKLMEQYGINDDNNIVEELDERYKSDGAFKEQIDAIPPLADLRARLESLEFQAAVIDNATFEAFITYLTYDPDPAMSRDWQYDNFYNTLSNYFSNEGWEIVYVGAAGNFQYPFSFAPAAWDFVDSISSGGDEDSSLAGYSNWGEIQMDGVYPHDSRIVGTSFAAPKFSYAIAHALLNGYNSPCPQSPSLYPILGYATSKDPVFADSSGASINANNLIFKDAMSIYCP